MSREDRVTITLLALGVLGVAWWSYQDACTQAVRHGLASQRRGVARGAVYGAALGPHLKRVTPDYLMHHFGPGQPHWSPTPITYPVTPGYELERLIYGVPGSWNTATPSALRGWLFEPPSEVDV